MLWMCRNNQFELVAQSLTNSERYLTVQQSKQALFIDTACPWRSNWWNHQMRFQVSWCDNSSDSWLQLGLVNPTQIDAAHLAPAFDWLTIRQAKLGFKKLFYGQFQRSLFCGALESWDWQSGTYGILIKSWCSPYTQLKFPDPRNWWTIELGERSKSTKQFL